ncbi:MAG: site-2 protease family protein [Cytophagaceae bacterium]|nr:site-2 protease family protein [Cytophagaceae bacterium]MDW8455780.1 site-2 protease family protein [Cytophagaceae bacterium]
MLESENRQKKLKQYFIHIGLFVATLFTTTYTGAYDWIGLQTVSGWEKFSSGFQYSLPFLFILACHEFGHFFMAKKYKVKTTLPYFIPMYLPFMSQIGTLGAVIRIKSIIPSKKEVFDIGVAGPLAGFIAAMAILYYGFTHLPDPDYIYNIHPDYKIFTDRGLNYADYVYNYQYARKMDSLMTIQHRIEDSIYTAQNQHTLWFRIQKFFYLAGYYDKLEYRPNESYIEIAMGKNLIFLFFENFVVKDKSKIPNKYEMFHYPLLFAGYLALFFTALNLFPVGQLDGGHVIYGLFGAQKHRYISSAFFTLFILIGGIGIFKDNFAGINVFTSGIVNATLFCAAYLYFLYIIFERTYHRNSFMVAVLVFAVQFFIEYFMPNIEGFNGWLIFGFLVGRILGTHHPPSPIEAPLDLKRKILGWLSLMIFALCFTPNVIIIETFSP